MRVPLAIEFISICTQKEEEEEIDNIPPNELRNNHIMLHLHSPKIYSEITRSKTMYDGPIYVKKKLKN